MKNIFVVFILFILIGCNCSVESKPHNDDIKEHVVIYNYNGEKIFDKDIYHSYLKIGGVAEIVALDGKHLWTNMPWLVEEK